MLFAAAVSLTVAACGTGNAITPPGAAAERPTPTTAPATLPPTSPPTTVRLPPTTTIPTPSTTRVVVPATTLPPPIEDVEPLVGQPIATTPLAPPRDPSLGATRAAFDRIAGSNAGASMTVVRGGDVIFASATGTTIGGEPATSDSPMVVASVSKLVVALAVARLEQQGDLDTSAPVPWADIGVDPHPAWGDVTVRDLLDHTSGMPVVRSSWFTGAGTCETYLPSLVDTPPEEHRGEWRYSNGNYCALGLIVEQRTELPLDVALQQLVFDPVGVDGAHLTTDGLQPDDVNYRLGVRRLSRLGGAGTLVVSTDDTAHVFGSLTLDDFETLRPPGVFTDQYGFGHTGTVDGAKACVWLMEFGRTVVAATIAGDSIWSGGGVCDVVVPAVATDLGFGAGEPDRTP